MKAAYVIDPRADRLVPLLREMGDLLAARGFDVSPVGEPPPRDVKLVLHATVPEIDRVLYVRPDPSVFVATVVESPDGSRWADVESLKRDTYRVLVKTMSNVVVHRVGGDGEFGGKVHFMTPELGFRTRPDEGLARRIVDYVAPLAESKVVIRNRLDEDLPEELWQGDEIARSLMAHGRKLAEMNLLPQVFDIRSLLDERDLRLAMKIFGLKQLSYGNLSARRDAGTFWMTGRGVDKGNLREIGRDVFLVKGYDPETATILLSVPPGTDPTARVSVDAIEHYKIYRAVPEVGAIVHVHAWLPGVPATLQSWPCGTEQLADEVRDLVLAAPDPSRAVIGLRNHGLTITGRSLEEIFERIEGKLVQEIPPLE